MNRFHFPETQKSSGFEYEAMYLERLPSYRTHVAAVLRGDGFARRYLQLLGHALVKAQGFFGERFSSQALIICLFLSLVYAWLLFLLGVTGGWENPLGQATGLIGLSSADATTRLFIFAFAVVWPLLMWPLGGWLARSERRLRYRRLRRQHPSRRKRWRRLYTLIVTTLLLSPLLLTLSVSGDSDLAYGVALIYLFIFVFILGPIIALRWLGRSMTLWWPFLGAGAGAVAGVGAGVGAGAVVGAGAGAGAVACMKHARSGISRENSLGAMIGTFFGISFGLAFSVGLTETVNIFLLITAAILPLVNGLLDFFSWWFSRWMGEHLMDLLQRTQSSGRRILLGLFHGLADVVLALFFFVGLAWLLGFVFESFDLWAGLDDVSLWQDQRQSGYIVTIKHDPFGAGLWITLMLFSTLVPTLIHLFFVIFAFVPMMLLPDARRERLAEELALLVKTLPEDPANQRHWVSVLERAARYAAGYRRRMFTSSLVAFLTLAILFSLFVQMHVNIGLDELAFKFGVNGIESARGVWGM